MFTTINQNTRRAVSAMAAVAVVAFGGLTLDQGHRAAALPAGVVELGELTPVDLTRLAGVTLPGIVVTAERVAPGELRAARRTERSQWLDGKASEPAGTPAAGVLLN